MGLRKLRHSVCHLGKQGQEVPRTTDRPSLVPFEGHKATEKADGATVISEGEDAYGPDRLLPCIPASSSQLRRDQRDSSQWEGWKLAEG